MKRFYPDFDTLDRFTLALDYHQEQLECTHCLKCDQFVSHGIIYKQRSIAHCEAVGKRIFCSNRYGRSGCGRTFQLYVASEVPFFRYCAAHLFVFITSLLASFSVKQAYHSATGQSTTRNAWRWLNRLTLNLSRFRVFLNHRIETSCNRFQARVRRFQILFPTLVQLSVHFKAQPCTGYQLVEQIAFI